MTKPNDRTAPILAAYDALASANDVTQITAGSFTQISALFAAIRKFAEPPHVFKDLTDLDSYLCDDWGNLHDCENEKLKEHFDKFHDLLYPEKRDDHE